MLSAVEHAKANPEAAADAHIGLSQQHRAGIRTPPACDTVRRRQGVEDDGGPGGDAAHESKAGHQLRFLASISLASA
jgi:hypothetical protein